MAMRFRFRPVPFIAAVLVAAAGFALGEWQTGRAQEKEAIEAKLTEREAMTVLRLNEALQPLDDLEYRHVSLRGEFVSDWNVYLDNRPHQGRAGFQVATPFRLVDGGGHVLVLRGWAPRNLTDRTQVPAAAAPQGVVEIEGRVRRHAGRVMQLGSPPVLQPGAIVQNLGVEELATASGRDLLPFVLEQTSDTGDGLARDWPRPSTGADKHRGYAFQWYGLAAAALVFFFVTGWTRGTSNTDQSR